MFERKMADFVKTGIIQRNVLKNYFPVAIKYLESAAADSATGMNIVQKMFGMFKAANNNRKILAANDNQVNQVLLSKNKDKAKVLEPMSRLKPYLHSEQLINKMEDPEYWGMGSDGLFFAVPNSRWQHVAQIHVGNSREGHIPITSHSTIYEKIQKKKVAKVLHTTKKEKLHLDSKFLELFQESKDAVHTISLQASVLGNSGNSEATLENSA